MDDEPIDLSDLISGERSRPIYVSSVEQRAFAEGVGREMERLGLDKANEITARSELLTAEDYCLMVY